MVLLAFALAAIVAEELVELAPVKAGTNVWKCQQYTTSTTCNSSPYCYWGGTTGSLAGCWDDPCLKYLGDGDVCPASVVLSGTPSITVNCAELNRGSTVLSSDCQDVQGTGKFCAQTSPTTTAFTYCTYAFLRDSSCPESVCSTTSTTFPEQCIKPGTGGSSTTTGCPMLSETDCALEPKCYWQSNSCQPDPCWSNTVGVVCSGVTPTGGGSCIQYQPYNSNGDGTIVNYCIHSSRTGSKTPNLCYFVQHNYSTSVDDYPQAYPTLLPLCGTDPLTNCNTDNCKTVVKKRGAFAGQYCADAAHEIGGSTVLRVPSLLIFLLVSAIISILVL